MAKFKRKRGFFTLTWKILIFSIVIYALNIIIILQLVPVFESSNLGAKLTNAIVFPANFIFEDLIGLESIFIIDLLTWVLQFFYIYLIVCIIRRIMKARIKL